MQNVLRGNAKLQDPAQHPVSLLHSPVSDSVDLVDAGFASLTNSFIPIKITERQCARPKSTHSPHRNNLITVKTTSSTPTVESAYLFTNLYFISIYRDIFPLHRQKYTPEPSLISQYSTATS